MQDKRILLTGGAGFLGRHVTSELKDRDPGEIIIPRSAEFDLRDQYACKTVLKDADIVIHLAGSVGGIAYNAMHAGELLYDNAIMGINLLEESRRQGIEKFVGIGSVCAYPKFSPVPFVESDLWNGYPEETNAPYGIAKRMMMEQTRAYSQQYGFNSIHLVLVNLYGPYDDFDPGSSHVIAALIKKFVDAGNSDDDEVIVWGSGSASREFLYVEDAAIGIVMATESYNKPDPVNLGAGFEITIFKLVELISELTGFSGNVIWDRTKPDGQMRRMLDVRKAKEEFGFEAKTEFRKGLKKTIEWYENL